jgi:hypothetical protein
MGGVSFRGCVDLIIAQFRRRTEEGAGGFLPKKEIWKKI